MWWDETWYGEEGSRCEGELLRGPGPLWSWGESEGQTWETQEQNVDVTWSEPMKSFKERALTSILFFTGSQEPQESFYDVLTDSDLPTRRVKDETV